MTQKSLFPSWHKWMASRGYDPDNEVRSSTQFTGTLVDIMGQTTHVGDYVIAEVVVPDNSGGSSLKLDVCRVIEYTEESSLISGYKFPATFLVINTEGHVGRVESEFARIDLDVNDYKTRLAMGMIPGKPTSS